MAKTIENLFLYLASYGAVVPLLFFVYSILKKNAEKPIYFLAAYCVIELLTNCIALSSSSSPAMRIISSFFTKKEIYSYFTILEYSLFACCFYLLIQSPVFKKVIIACSIAFLLFSVLYLAFVEYLILDSVPIGIESLLIISYSFYFLYEEMEKPSQVFIYNRYTFWIVSGIMIYLAGSFFIYIFASQVDSETRHLYWIFSNAFTVLKYIFFVISMLVFRRQLKAKAMGHYPSPYLN